jgi:hypothetical protein
MTKGVLSLGTALEANVFDFCKPLLKPFLNRSQKLIRNFVRWNAFDSLDAGQSTSHRHCLRFPRVHTFNHAKPVLKQHHLFDRCPYGLFESIRSCSYSSVYPVVIHV